MSRSANHRAAVAADKKHEQRTQKRYDVRFSVDFTYNGKNHTGHCRNLSLGGIFLETDVPVPFESVVSLTFTPPGFDQPLQSDGQVRWVEKKDGRPTGVGLLFLRLRARYAWALNRLFARLG